MTKKLSKVEVKGFEALFYDQLMMLFSGFTYGKFIRNVIRDMEINQNDSILDLGSGTGKNICLMKRYTNGKIVGLDIGKEMLMQSKRRCSAYPNVRIFYHDIRKPTPFIELFDKVFISFVLHGFIDEERDLIIKNAYDSLKKGGAFCILDYNEFDLEEQSLPVRLVFKYGECPLASQFITIDLKKKLSRFGFGDFVTHTYYGSLVRLLIGYK